MRKPVEIHNKIYLIGGSGLTGAGNCLIYLIKTSEGLILVDYGLGEDLDRLIGNIKKFQFSSRLRWNCHCLVLFLHLFYNGWTVSGISNLHYNYFRVSGIKPWHFDSYNNNSGRYSWGIRCVELYLYCITYLFTGNLNRKKGFKGLISKIIIKKEFKL